MSSTYLTIVNSVLRRLRENEVSGVANTTYSKMVGDFVNDAKTQVENSHDWSALRTTIVVPTVSGTTDYTLTNSGERIKVYSAINDTSNFFMNYESPNWFNNAYFISGEVSGTPDSYTFIGIDSSRDTKIKVFPKPDAVYSLRFDVIARENELSSDTDTTVLPSNPIVHLAVAYLARERGETGGTTAQDYFAIADRNLSDAIALDAYKNPEEFIFKVP
jgi:hypothetical protein|tara:strand:- start:148 stop:801 length:654 start_codon:yes stop_codon:yes gene_type:complete